MNLCLNRERDNQLYCHYFQAVLHILFKFLDYKDNVCMFLMYRMISSSKYQGVIENTMPLHGSPIKMNNKNGIF